MFMTMHAPASCLLTWVILVCAFVVGAYHCVAYLEKTECSVKNDRANCAHLNLSTVPQDLPENITSLVLSHNRLALILPDSLNRYKGLLHLDVSYNSIAKLGEALCQNLPLLQSLNLAHNEVGSLSKEHLEHCTSLTWLNLASNRLKLQGEPFTALKVLVQIVCLRKHIFLLLVVASHLWSFHV